MENLKLCVDRVVAVGLNYLGGLGDNFSENFLIISFYQSFSILKQKRLLCYIWE